MRDDEREREQWEVEFAEFEEIDLDPAEREAIAKWVASGTREFAVKRGKETVH